MVFKRPIICLIAVSVGLLLFSGAYAANEAKPLYDWLKPQVTVYNDDFDNVIHFDIAYNISTLFTKVAADTSIKIGGYLSLHRGETTYRSYFTEYAIRQLAREGYIFEDAKSPNRVYWTEFALSTIDDLAGDSIYNNLKNSGNILNHDKVIESFKTAQKGLAIHQITYFWVCLFRIDPPSKFVNDDNMEDGAGAEKIMGYYWGVFANEKGEAAHGYLTVPESPWDDKNNNKQVNPGEIEYHGPGKYKIYIKPRLGTWDGSYYNSTGIDGWVAGPEFEVRRFKPVLPVPVGSKIENPGSDTTVRVYIPPLNSYSDYNPDFHPYAYMIEIATYKEAFNNWEPMEIPPVVRAYALTPKKPDQPLSVDVDIKSLQRYRGPVLRSDFNENDIDLMIEKNFIFDIEDPYSLFWTEGALTDILDLNLDSTFKNIRNRLRNPDGLVNSHRAARTAKTAFYGQIRTVGPPPGSGIYWTPSLPFDLGTVELTHWQTLLAGPSSVQVKNSPNPNAGGGIDSSIIVTIEETTPSEVVHDGYAITVNIIGADDSVYSETLYISDLELVDINPSPDIAELKIPKVERTIDVKELFDDGSNFLEEVVGIPPNTQKEITITVSSIKAGYASSDPVNIGPVVFKNTDESFLPEIKGINIYSVDGTPVIKAEIPPYPSEPSTIPPYDSDIRCEIQYSTVKDDPTTPGDEGFPWDPGITITIYDSTVPEPSRPGKVSEPAIFTKEISDILDIGKPVNTVYVRARLRKSGYTPGKFTDITEIEITEYPPFIIDYKAEPTSGVAPLTVKFEAESKRTIDFTWVFGDDDMEIAYPEPTISHEYKKAGVYTVVLLANGEGNLKDRMKKEDYITVYSPCDFNQDGDVDWGDLAEFNAAYLSKYDIKADFNKDGIVNMLDYGILANDWSVRAPSELAVEATSASQIVFSWKDNSDGEGGFKIEISRDGAETFQPLTTVGAGITEFTVNCLQPKETAHFRLFAFGVGGANSCPSGGISLTMPLTGDIMVNAGESIREAVEGAFSGDIIVIHSGVYEDNIAIYKGIRLIGENQHETIIQGDIVCENADVLIQDLTIKGGIKSINSEITVKGCVISGGIEIWALAGTSDIAPLIENNLLLGGDIFLFSHADGGAISGEISNNTMDDCSIVIRMSKVHPAIYNNIVTATCYAIYLTYDSLPNKGLNSIANNCFFGNSRNVWCEELRAGQSPGQLEANGNINVDPEFSDKTNLDYLPMNPDCAGMGYRD